MRRHIDLLVFDWDGTIMDSAGRIVDSLRTAISEMELPERSDAQLRDVIGLGLTEALLRLFPGLDEAQQQRLVQRYRDQYLQSSSTPESPFPQAGAVLEAAADAGFMLAVATGKGRRGLEKGLAASGFASHFQVTRCVDEAPSKPHPQMLLDILTDLDTPPERALMIGDSEYDLLMAQNAGVRAIAACYGAHDRERLLAYRPLACLEQLGELIDLLQRDDVLSSDSTT